MEELKWNELYAKFSEYLYQFYIEYGEYSGKILYETCRMEDPNYKILPWVENLEKHEVQSIDPIHIFASFNYWKITENTKKKRISFFCNLIKRNNIGIGNILYEIDNSKLDVFNYFPHINIQKVVSSRPFEIQKEVWDFFALVYKNDIEGLNELFNKIDDTWFGVKVESATIFMFWVNSDNFLPLDKNTVALLEKYNFLKEIPSTFENYKVLIKKRATNLYRNIAMIAIDEKLKYSLDSSDLNELELYLNKGIELILNEPIIKTEKNFKLDIDLIPDFNFELYFMLKGNIKKIIYKNNKIFSIHTLELDNINEKTSYPNFQLIAIKALDSKYTKILKQNKLYYFNQNFKINNDNVTLTNKKIINLYTGYEINNINISAIVGKNGTGKSTIIELLIMAINNITYSIQYDNNKSLKELEEFFYTIHTNYSLHSLNEKYYDGEWLHKLFHKNDAYQTPIVIEPYRNKGNIDVNKLDSLTKQRLLSTILEPSVDNKDALKLTENKYATHLDISLNKEKIYSIIDTLIENKSDDGELKPFLIGVSFGENDINSILQYKKYQNIIKYFDGLINIGDLELEATPSNTKNKDELSVISTKINEDELLYKKITIIYICYKIKNITNTYQEYYQYKVTDPNDVYKKEYLDKLLDDKSHITFKLHQAIYFLKYHTIKVIDKVSIEDLSREITNIKDDNYAIVSKNYNLEVSPRLKTIELIPPSFFNVDIILDNEIKFDTLSSGEKQKIYTTSSVIYHLQNIQSTHQNNSNNINYSYVNIILDEIELYFHPDMQRTFINDLLMAIENKGGFNNITSLNILLVTHSPFILSDILKSNIMYLKDNKEINIEDDFKDTFGANIHTLLDNSFFMKNGLMGKYAKNRIEKIIEKLNLHKEKKEMLDKIQKDEIRQIISNIGEPFLKQKLFDMYQSILQEHEVNTEIELLKKEKDIINKKLKKLKE